MACNSRHTSQTVLITGASAGIGRCLAMLFAKGGFNLVLVARRGDVLQDMATECVEKYGVRVDVMPTDLLDEDACADLIARLEVEQIAIDILVNNAGILEWGAFSETDLEKHQKLLQLNISVPALLTYRLLPSMLAKGYGRILNVASISAFQPIPSLALYAASKAFVLSMSESLSEELNGSGISVTALCPGITRTDMLEQVKGSDRIPGFFISEVDSVAQAGYEACLAGRAVVVPGVSNQVIATTSQVYPRWLMRKLAAVVGPFMVGGAS